MRRLKPATTIGDGSIINKGGIMGEPPREGDNSPD